MPDDTNRHLMPDKTPQPTARFRALTEAWQAVDNAVRPLGGYSPWNEGFTTARNSAQNAILALRDAEMKAHCCPACGLMWAGPDPCAKCVRAAEAVLASTRRRPSDA